jgi:hypothetical protein
MTSFNDAQTCATAHFVGDNLHEVIAHFSRPDATWDGFGKSDVYLKHLQLGLAQLSHEVDVELLNRQAVEPTDFGS